MSQDPMEVMIESGIHSAFPELRACIEKLVDKLQPTKIILFGSFARGQGMPDSDIDIMVILDQPFNPQFSRMQAIRQARQVLKSVHCPKDVLVFNLDEVKTWQGSLNHIIGKAFREGWTLYERL